MVAQLNSSYPSFGTGTKRTQSIQDWDLQAGGQGSPGRSQGFKESKSPQLRDRWARVHELGSTEHPHLWNWAGIQ